ncbi:MAG TPA: TIR domain-containing protein [Sphingomonadaceae bacterium]
MRGPDIFISYTREDIGMARMFASSFAREGFNVWWDAAIHSGETFDEVIEQALRGASAVVVLWSPRSVGSRWVRAEATLADRNKTLAPVVIEPCNRPIIFELTHTVDLSHWKGEPHDGAWQVFLHDVRRLVESGRGKSGSEEGPPASAHASRPQSGPPPQVEPGALAQLAGQGGLDSGKVDNLISMLASLQETMKQGAHKPVTALPDAAPSAPPPAIEEDEAKTQFYTASDQYQFLDQAEFHCLEIEADGEVAKRFPVGPLGLKIGRTAPADAILADPKVSRSHCTVELHEDELFVTDLSSTNGTFVDGKRVTGAALLPVGSVLTIGGFELVHQVRSRAEV